MNGTTTTITETLKRLDLDRLAMEDLVEHAAHARKLTVEYGEHSIPVPEWLRDVTTALTREIRAKSRDLLELRKRELLKQAQGLESAEEKRQRIARELSEIDGKLGNPVPTTTTASAATV
jgi:signal transduction histidine kinase